MFAPDIFVQCSMPLYLMSKSTKIVRPRENWYFFSLNFQLRNIGEPIAVIFILSNIACPRSSQRMSLVMCGSPVLLSWPGPGHIVPRLGHLIRLRPEIILKPDACSFYLSSNSACFQRNTLLILKWQKYSCRTIFILNVCCNFACATLTCKPFGM